MRTKQRGLTLIELLVSVSIIGILASVALPSFSEMISRGQLVSMTEQLQQNLLFAQSEAIRRNQALTLDFNGGDSTNWDYNFTYQDCSTNPCTTKSAKSFDSSFESSNVTIKYTPALDGAKYSSDRGFIDNTGEISLTNKSLEKTIIKIDNKLGRPRICSANVNKYSSC